MTSVFRSSFQCSLRAANKGFRNVVTGAPIAPRTSVSEAGDWAGVAFVSKYPCRALQVGWPPDLFETGRIQFCTSFVGPFWLTGGVVYGYPPGVYLIQVPMNTPWQCFRLQCNISRNRVLVRDFWGVIGTLNLIWLLCGKNYSIWDGSKCRTFEKSNLEFVPRPHVNAKPEKTSCGCHRSW